MCTNNKPSCRLPETIRTFSLIDQCDGLVSLYLLLPVS